MADLDLPALLADYTPRPFDPVSGAYAYSTRTPAHAFSTVLAPVPDTPYYAVVTARDSFDPGLAADAIRFVGTRPTALDPRRPATKLLGFRPSGRYPFDTVMILSPSVANHYDDDDRLNAATFRAFPAYTCEFSGDETPDDLETMVYGTIPTVDWNRKPHPKVGMRFVNPRARTRTKGSGLQLTEINNVLENVSALAGQTKGVLELENYLGDRLTITPEKARFVLAYASGQSLPVEPSEIGSHLVKFLQPPTR